jgi:hypothetical protein
MQERVRIFTFSSGTGSTVIEPRLEDNINEWLSQTEGRITHVTQSESERQGTAHTTIAIWYVPERDA